MLMVLVPLYIEEARVSSVSDSFFLDSIRPDLSRLSFLSLHHSISLRLLTSPCVCA